MRRQVIQLSMTIVSFFYVFTGIFFMCYTVDLVIFACLNFSNISLEFANFPLVALLL